MDPEIADRVTEWPSRRVSGGHEALATLADEEFSGAVVLDGTYLFLLNGRVLGVADGTLDGVATADGTAYTAPHPGLPLLFAMQTVADTETRARYYTEDTPLREVHETLSEGGFTGYVELSENVLSGDYHVAYYGGRSLASAVVGSAGEVVTGDEAFDLAADEVGIYEVVQAPLDVTDVPRPDADGTTAAGATDGDDPGHDDTADGAGREDGTTTEGGPEGGRETDTDAGAEVGSDASTEPGAADGRVEPSGTAADPGPDGDSTSTAGAGPDTDTDTDTDTGPGARAEPPDGERDPETDRGAGRTDRTPTRDRSRSPDRAGRETASTDETARRGDAGARTGGAGETGDRRQDSGTGTRAEAGGEQAWDETRVVPALDPEESTVATDGDGRPAGGTGGASAPAASGGDAGADAGRNGRESAGPRRDRGGQDRRVATLREEVETLEAALADARGRAEELAADRDELAATVEDLETELADTRAERERLEERVTELEAELAEARATVESQAGGAEGTALSPAEALAGTSLFVRYDSKADPTLEAVAEGTDRATVDENLQLGVHTRFDDETTTVDGDPFDTFLRSTLEWAVVTWLVRELPYEIRDSGAEDALSELYGAIPEIDRVEFDGVVEVEGEGPEDQVRAAYDVVCRGRKGDPLVVADIEDSRDPVTGEAMDALVERSSAVAGAAGSLGAALSVTASFFEPAALEAAEAETGGGLLSRDSRASFVRTSRSAGYHLCLVEARDGGFYVTVPEL